MTRLFLASAGLGLCFKLLIKADDTVTQSIALLFIPVFVVYGYFAISKIINDRNQGE